MTDVYERRELKFLLDEMQKAALTAILESHIAPGPFPESEVRNVYYDTPDYRLIRTSLEKPEYKEKLRLRSYGAAKPGDAVYVELKKKYDGVVYKRRIPLEYRGAAAFLQGRGETPDCQIGREIAYVLHFYRNLRPMVYISYDRKAWADESTGLRVTIDENIAFRTDCSNLGCTGEGRPILRSGQGLLEVKARGAIPMWLAESLSTLGIRQVSFSKYGKAYEILNQKPTSGGNQYVYLRTVRCGAERQGKSCVSGGSPDFRGGAGRVSAAK